MAVCPDGHVSSEDDFCDDCGLPIAASPSPSSPSSPSSAPGEPASSERCPWCGTPRDGRFCEEDGYDFVVRPAEPPAPPAPAPPAPAPPAPAPPAPAPPAPGTSAPGDASWMVTVEADARYFALVGERRGPDFASVTFPTYYPTSEVALTGDEVRIGRSPAAVPLQIDLSGPPSDPGVSRLHAVLLARPDGGWSVLDPGSTNGTTINYDDEPIETDRPVPVHDGDRIHVGAYTTLLLAARRS